MLKLIFNKKAFQKISAYILLIILLFIFKDFLSIFLLTFIFSYLFFSMAKYIKEKLYTLSKKHLLFSFFKKLPIWLIVLMEYVVFVWLIVYIFSSIIPSVKAEINSITNEFLVINTVDEDNKNFEFIDSEKSGSIKIINAINDFKESLLQKIILIDPEDNLKIIDYIENFWKDFDFKSFKNNSIYILSVLGN